MLFQLKGNYQNLFLDCSEGKTFMKYVSMDYLYFFWLENVTIYNVYLHYKYDLT